MLPVARKIISRPPGWDVLRKLVLFPHLFLPVCSSGPVILVKRLVRLFVGVNASRSPNVSSFLPVGRLFPETADSHDVFLKTKMRLQHLHSGRCIRLLEMSSPSTYSCAFLKTRSLLLPGPHEALDSQGAYKWDNTVEWTVFLQWRVMHLTRKNEHVISDSRNIQWSLKAPPLFLHIVVFSAEWICLGL